MKKKVPWNVKKKNAEGGDDDGLVSWCRKVSNGKNVSRHADLEPF